MCWPTHRGEPLPFVPCDDAWEPEPGDGPPAFVEMYRQSLETYADRVPAARIPVDRIRADVVLAAGGDDALWPSVLFVERIRRRRDVVGLPTTLVSLPGAGHRVVLPGEAPPPRRVDLAHGGSPEAGAELGRMLWRVMLPALRGG